MRQDTFPILHLKYHELIQIIHLVNIIVKAVAVLVAVFFVNLSEENKILAPLDYC